MSQETTNSSSFFISLLNFLKHKSKIEPINLKTIQKLPRHKIKILIKIIKAKYSFLGLFNEVSS